MTVSSIPEEHWEHLKNKIECLFQERGIEIKTCLNLPMSHGHIAQDERTLLILLERDGKYLEVSKVVDINHHLLYGGEFWDKNGFLIENSNLWDVNEYDKTTGHFIKNGKIILNQFFDKWSSK